jgi:peroxiredoxin family protein
MLMVVSIAELVIKINKKETLSMNIISCTEAGKILNISKDEVKELVEQQKLNNFGSDYRYMVSKEEVNSLKK